jgi:hypothetical protein
VTLDFPRSLRTLCLSSASQRCSPRVKACPRRLASPPRRSPRSRPQGFVENDTGWALSVQRAPALRRRTKARCHPEQQTRITAMARNLVSVGIATARIEGHSDSTGTAAYNLALSQARAQAVAAPLASGRDALYRRPSRRPRRNRTAVEQQHGRRTPGQSARRCDRHPTVAREGKSPRLFLPEIRR